MFQNLVQINWRQLAVLVLAFCIHLNSQADQLAPSTAVDIASPRGGDIVIPLKLTLEDIVADHVIDFPRAGEKAIHLDIPGGVADGMRIRLRGLGEASTAGGAPGDLYFQLQVVPHAVFERDGDDLKCTVRITRDAAEKGGDIDVPSLDGKLRLALPKGVKSGQFFRIAGKGLQKFLTKQRGDLLFYVLVEDEASTGQPVVLKSQSAQPSHPTAEEYEAAGFFWALEGANTLLLQDFCSGLKVNTGPYSLAYHQYNKKIEDIAILIIEHTPGGGVTGMLKLNNFIMTQRDDAIRNQFKQLAEDAHLSMHDYCAALADAPSNFVPQRSLDHIDPKRFQILNEFDVGAFADSPPVTEDGKPYLQRVNPAYGPPMYRASSVAFTGEARDRAIVSNFAGIYVASTVDLTRQCALYDVDIGASVAKRQVDLLPYYEKVERIARRVDPANQLLNSEIDKANRRYAEMVWQPGEDSGAAMARKHCLDIKNDDSKLRLIMDLQTLAPDLLEMIDAAQ